MSITGLPRIWPTIDIPGVAEGGSTYWDVDLDAMPPVEITADGTLDWLLNAPTHVHSLEEGPDDRPERQANPEGLEVVAANMRLPVAFRRFIEDPEPRRHIRSATDCFLDLGHFVVSLDDGGSLVHFLSDQQWVLHWLLYVEQEGSEAVIATGDPIGYEDHETMPVEVKATEWPGDAVVCGDSFEEFLYRYWAMNELFFRLAVDDQTLDDLPEELRTYARRHPTKPST